MCQTEVDGNFWMSLCPGFNATYGCVPNEVPGLSLTCGNLPTEIAPLRIPGEPCSENTDCWSVQPGYVWDWMRVVNALKTNSVMLASSAMRGWDK